MAQEDERKDARKATELAKSGQVVDAIRALESAGPVARNIGPERTRQIADQLSLGVGDAVFFVAGKPRDFIKFAGAARTKVGTDLE